MYTVLAFYSLVDIDLVLPKEIHLYEGNKRIDLPYDPEKTVSDVIEIYLDVFLRNRINRR